MGVCSRLHADAVCLAATCYAKAAAAANLTVTGVTEGVEALPNMVLQLLQVCSYHKGRGGETPLKGWK